MTHKNHRTFFFTKLSVALAEIYQADIRHQARLKWNGTLVKSVSLANTAAWGKWKNQLQPTRKVTDMLFFRLLQMFIKRLTQVRLVAPSKSSPKQRKCSPHSTKIKQLKTIHVKIQFVWKAVGNWHFVALVYASLTMFYLTFSPSNLSNRCGECKDSVTITVTMAPLSVIRQVEMNHNDPDSCHMNEYFCAR